MALPETDVFRIRRWCEARVPKHLWPKLKLEADVAATHVTLVEVRPPWDGQGEPMRHPVARLRFNASRKQWALYWRDRNQKFHAYEAAQPTSNVQALLDVVGSHKDPIFFG